MMRTIVGLSSLVLWSGTVFGQTFGVASVKVSARAVGKDSNNQIAFGPAGFTGKNVTLKRLIVEAYGLQPHQVSGGPNWLELGEYDIDAKADGPVKKEQLSLMLLTLITDRFRLGFHR